MFIYLCVNNKLIIEFYTNIISDKSTEILMIMFGIIYIYIETLNKLWYYIIYSENSN